MDWGEDVLLLLGVDLRLSRLPEEELRARVKALTGRFPLYEG